MSTTNLSLVYENNLKKSSLPPIYLLCVFRDEELLLDYFIKYYKALGVTHFIMIDNMSEDGGGNYLKQQNKINIKIYQTSDSYREAAFGTNWVNELLMKHCVNQYCFVVDTDELFYFNKRKNNNLRQLINRMESSNSNVIAVTLLDMYPKTTNDGYIKGESFLEHSSFFDTFNASYYKTGFLYEKNLVKSGGVRMRVLKTSVCLHKFPFFKFDFHPIKVAAGYHMFQQEGENIIKNERIKLYSDPAVLLHFKFIKPDLKSFFKRRVLLNQDWDDSIEYKSYVKEISENSKIQFFDQSYSKKMKTNRSLEMFFEFVNCDLKMGNVVSVESGTQEKELSLLQKVGILIFGFFSRVFMSRAHYLKLRRKPRLFFSDSRNSFVKKIGAILKLG